MPRALAGLDSSLISTIAGVRNALDRRVERGVFGEEVNSSSMLAALRSVRTGHFTSVKLLHLISKEDSSSPADPLKGFRALSRAEAATAMRDAFAKLTQVISVASPNLASTAIPFIEKLKKRLCTAIDDDVGWSQISDYYASIMRKVAQPTRQYSFGEGGSLYAVFDSEWIDAHSTARDELERATQEKRAEAAATRALSGKLPRREGDDMQGESKRSKKKRLRSERAAAKKATVMARASTVTDGDAVPRDKADKAALEKFEQEHPSKQIDGETVHACWGFWHAQGCTFGKACKFHHESDSESDPDSDSD